MSTTAYALFIRSPWYRNLDRYNESELMRQSRECIKNDPKENCYDVVSFESNLDKDIDICDRIFDITNNPNLNEERQKLFPNVRSMSVGDLVYVNNKFYICMPIGWIHLHCF